MKQFLAILLFSISANIYADEVLFATANNLYTNGDYSAAISKYDSILSNNIESYEIYYNLGNCYYKTGDWANAIWHYEKSLRIEKNEKTIQNLALTNLKIIDRIEPLPQLFYTKWLKNISQLFSIKIWQILALVCMWCFLIVKILYPLTNFKKNKMAHILLLMAILSFFIANFSYTTTITKKEGIIFSSTVIVNSAPTTNSTDLFSLHSGAKVEVIDEIGDWINIKLTNGNTGWLKKNNCRTLY